ncbi:hypothetical protein [Natrinema sp. 74]|uniref:DUF7344 domain-containing protein n=1 Tax=Natrinema sp. 74 TaxID=3384159 RepID=UPI0038D5168D
MSSSPASDTTTAIAVLAKPRRRYLLATLRERADTASDRSSQMGRLSVGTLATEVATTEHGCPIVTDDQCEQTQTALYHLHVPRLVDLGLLTRESRGDTTIVGLDDHPILEADWVQTVLEDPTGESFPADEETLNRTLQALRAPRRRAVCAVLATRHGAISVSELATAVATREATGETDTADANSADEAHTTTSIVHEHLPALADAGLVEYDRNARRVALATDAPQWEADWLLEGLLADVSGFKRRSGRGDDTAEDQRDSDETTSDETGAAESATDSGNMSWMLARPRAGCSSSEETSPRELTNPVGSSSTATDGHD